MSRLVLSIAGLDGARRKIVVGFGFRLGIEREGLFELLVLSFSDGFLFLGVFDRGFGRRVGDDLGWLRRKAALCGAPAILGKHRRKSSRWVVLLGGAALQRCGSVAFWKRLRAAEVAMAAPLRGNTGFSTYFITAGTFQKQSLFQSDRMADLFLEVLLNYRSQQKYLLHEFVIMPDHFHLLLTPTLTLERALQLIKGGFSYRAKRELGLGGEMWEKSYYDRRVRDWREYCAFRQYIHLNPVKRGLAGGGEYIYGSAKSGMVLDAVPQRLKPSDFVAV